MAFESEYFAWIPSGRQRLPDVLAIGDDGFVTVNDIFKIRSRMPSFLCFWLPIMSLLNFFASPKPTITIDPALPSSEWSTGSFNVTFDAEHGQILVKSKGGRVLWETIPSTPFIQSSQGKDDMGTGEGGAFQIKEHDTRTTTHQNISSISYEGGNAVRIAGTLAERTDTAAILRYTFEFVQMTDNQLRFVVEISGVENIEDVGIFEHVLITYASRKEEQFYGFGEQFSFCGAKGEKVPILVREQGIGRGDQPITTTLNNSPSIFGTFAGGDRYTTYAPMPHYISTDDRSVFLENTEYSSFDLRKDDRVVIRVTANIITGRILNGSNMFSLITEYTSHVGRMRPLPPWVGLGAIAGMQGGSAKVRSVFSQLRAHNVPLAGFWLQDWCGKRIQKVGNRELKRLWWNWEHDTELYPDWDELVRELREDQGGELRMLSYVNTFLADVKSKANGFKRNLFVEAAEKGLLVMDPTRDGEKGGILLISSGPEFEAGLLDLTNEETRSWFKVVVKESVFKNGVVGYMADFGEYTPYSSAVSRLHSGIPVESYHNAYSHEWARLHDEVVRELGLEGEAVMFHRSAFTLSPGRMNLMWAGDQNVTWDEHDGIKSAVTGMICGGFSGLAITHSDIGGYTTFANVIPGINMIRSRELLFRWMELAAFTACFRTHEGNMPDDNAQFYDDDASYTHFAYCARLFVSLAPYRQHLIDHDATKLGWPLMRHMVLYYPEDLIVRELTYQQYLLGAHLLVAPILSPSSHTVKVYLPAHTGVRWRHLWSNKVYEAQGQYITVEAPLGRPGVFVREPREDGGLLDGAVEFAKGVVGQ